MLSVFILIRKLIITHFSEAKQCKQTFTCGTFGFLSHELLIFILPASLNMFHIALKTYHQNNKQFFVGIE